MAEILPFKQKRRGASPLPLLMPWVVVGALMVATAPVYWLQPYWSDVGATDHTQVPLANIEVVDGDTIRAGGNIFRLVGFDTPEKGSLAKCQSERLLAERATNRLRQIVAAGNLQLDRVACACTTGTEGTKQCNYGRLCAQLKASRRDVRDILVGEGLARAYTCRGTTCPPRESWC
jgi:endonuclease YncB( thermonuclease family)